MQGRCHRVAAILRTVLDKQFFLEGTEPDEHLTRALCILQYGTAEGESMEGLAYQRRKKPRSID